ncbi:OsmC family protein [Phenylobacterium sp.]|jgi:uncharacterized OsmC-like protein|uniref:OsmC family protein n=1 Tax=Phenylobacterium sp. TaxID=1871053 RepID=UPI004036C7BB
MHPAIQAAMADLLGEKLMLEYAIQARRIDAHGSLASAKDATLVLDTDLQGRPDAFNPVELLLAAVAACMIKGVERVTPLLNFELNGVEVRLKAARQDSPPLITSIDYEIIVDTAESDQRLDLLHKNIRKYGTISNTVARATALDGRITRRTVL